MTRRSPYLALLLAASVLIGTTSCGLLPDSKQHFTAQFQSALGLYVGNDVVVLGYPVGKVERVTAHPEYVDVEFSVDADVTIPAEAKAVVLRPGIVTDRALELTPAYTGGERLADGATLGQDRTFEPLEYDELMRAVDDFVEAMAPAGEDVVHDAVSAAADLFGENGPRFRRAVAGLADASRIAGDAAPDITALVKDLNVVVGAVAEHETTLRRFSANLADLTSMFAADGAQLREALAALASSMRETATFVRRNRASIVATARQATGIVGVLTKRTRELTEIVDVFPLTFDNLSRAIDPKTGALNVKLSWAEMLAGLGIVKQFCTMPTIPVLCQLLTLATPTEGVE
ncbi:MAG TPA: MCE family protein [Nocardioidaceae bacterium]|nr:MCE family protein [Nocardioidaceae bacterium]